MVWGSNPLLPVLLVQVLYFTLSVLYTPGARQQETHEGRLSVRACSARAGQSVSVPLWPLVPICKQTQIPPITDLGDNIQRISCKLSRVHKLQHSTGNVARSSQPHQPSQTEFSHPVLDFSLLRHERWDKAPWEAWHTPAAKAGCGLLH